MTGGRGRGRRGSLAKRGRGRGRGRDREATETTTHDSDSSISETRKDQGFASSPVLPRYPTRHSRAATLAQCATLNSALRKPIRCINTQQSPEDLVGHATSASSFSIPHNAVYVPTNFGDFQSNKKDKCIPNVGNSVLAGSAQGSQAPPSFNFTEYVQKKQEDLDESCGNKPEKSTANDRVPSNSQRWSRYNSLNITEYAKRQQDDMDDDPEEVESALDPAFEIVDGHKVKKETAPLLRAIFEKYGDITIGSDSKPSNFLSYELERVCDIYARLARSKFYDVTRIELTDMLDEVIYLEHQKLNLGWLRAKLEYISQTKINFQEYLSIKAEAAKDEACIGIQKEKLEAYNRELADLQEKISAAAEELRAKESKSDQSRKMVLDIKDRVISLMQQSLVQGLL